MEPFAVFVIAPAWEVVFEHGLPRCREAASRYAEPLFAGVRRADGNLALPGGKVDSGEFPSDAVRREALEEGWCLFGDLVLFHQAEVDGRLVAWYSCAGAVRQRPRPGDSSNPVNVSLDALTGFGNEEAVWRYRNAAPSA